MTRMKIWDESSRTRWPGATTPGTFQNCLLVTRQNGNHSPGPGRLVPSSHQRSELSNTILGTFSRGDKRVWQCIPVPNGLGGGATLINISVSNGDLIYHRMIIPAAPNQVSLLVYWLYPSDLCITIWVYCLSSVSWGIPILNVQETVGSGSTRPRPDQLDLFLFGKMRCRACTLFVKICYSV